MAINDINSRISDPCRVELGPLNDLRRIWDRLKNLYIETLVGEWVKEIGALLKLRGARKEGENLDEWLRKVVSKAESAKENLGELIWNILAAFILMVDLGDDLTNASSKTHRLAAWPSPETLRCNILGEYYSKLHVGRTKPTALERPPNSNLNSSNNPKLNIT